MERAMIDDYFDDIDLVARYLDAGNHATTVDLLRWPESVRGFGDIKLAARREALERREALRSALQNPDRDRRAA